MVTKTRVLILIVFAVLCVGLLFFIFKNTASQNQTAPAGAAASTTTTATGTASNAATTTPSSTAATTVTPTALAQHASSADCWMAINGTVYDVTRFVSSHPGGSAILKGCGKDATQMFNSVPVHAGSNATQDLKGLPVIGTHTQ